MDCTYVKKGGKDHMAGNVNPFLPVIDLSGVDGLPEASRVGLIPLELDVVAVTRRVAEKDINEPS